MFRAGGGSLPNAHFTPGRPLVAELQCIGETSQPPCCLKGGLQQCSKPFLQGMWKDIDKDEKME